MWINVKGDLVWVTYLCVAKVRGGRLTYFGIVVNAVVVSTMIAFSTGMWGGAQVLASATGTALQSEQTVSPETDPPVLSLDEGGRDQVINDGLDIGAHRADFKESGVTDHMPPLPRDHRIRLAHYLPPSTEESAYRHNLDLLLAKAYTVRSRGSNDSQSAIRVYRSNTALPSVSAEALSADTESEQTEQSLVESPESTALDTLRVSEELTAGDALLAQAEVAEAYARYFNVVNIFPDSAESNSLDEALNYLIWDAERGLANSKKLCTLADSLPRYDACSSDKAIYWLIAVHQAAGHVLFQEGDSEESRSYLTYCRDTAAAFMQEDPSSPYQLFIPGLFLASCHDLGQHELEKGLVYLHQGIAAEASNTVLKFASRHALATHYNSTLNDIIEGGVQVMSAIDEYPNSIPAQFLKERASTANIRSHLNFSLGYFYYHMAQFYSARNYFDDVVEDNDTVRLVDAAAYMRAYMTELMDLNQTEEIIQAYTAYIDSWPQGEYVDKALLRVAAILEQEGNLRDAARTYRTLVDLYPEAPWRDKISALLEDIDGSIAAGMEEQLRGDRFIAVYGTQWCGPYALALLLEAERYTANLNVLAEAGELQYRGTSMAGLQNAAAETGYFLYGVHLADASFIQAPAIAHLTSQHFVFVSAVSEKELQVEDINGVRWVSVEDFNRVFSGYILTADEPDPAALAEPSLLQDLWGGDTFTMDLTEAYMQCINQDLPDECITNGTPVYGGGAGINPVTAHLHSLGTISPGEIHQTPSVNVPGMMVNPSDPSINTNIPFGGKGLNVGMGTNHRAMSIEGTDIHIPIKGALDFSFERTYYNPWGSHRAYNSTEALPYKNNIGSGWRHNYNVHVRLSSENGYLAYVDARGNFKRFTRFETDVNGYDVYERVSLDMDAGDINALRTERAIRAKRHIQTGKIEILFPDGMTCHFSAPINAADRYCRLESIQDVSGNAITLSYIDLLVPGSNNVTSNFGRLARVYAPTGDDRYLQFYYTGNRVERVELVKPQGTGTQVLQKVNYSYGAFKDGQGGPYNYLRAVTINDNPNDKVFFEYEKGIYDNEVVGTYPSKITDKEGNQLLIDCTYSYVLGNNFVSTSQIALTYPDGLTTIYEKTYKDYTDIRNYDGETPLSRFFFKIDGHGVRVDYARYYHEPAGYTFDYWTYSYVNNYDLTAVSNVAVQYWYNDDGRVVRYACGGVNYRYEYPAGGGLYPIRMYGPGTASESDKGPMTEYVYDSNNRLIQVKPPNVGSNGISFAYDAFGQLETLTNAAGNAQTYTYDSRGNRTSFTDYENNTTTYTYDDLGRVLTQTNAVNESTTYSYSGGCSSCGGASGQIATITTPDNRQVSFDYDNNGNLIRQTDPMGHNTAYEYDSLNRLIRVITEGGRQQTFVYDKLGNMIKKTGFGGKITHYAYDHRGLMTRTWIQVKAVQDTLVENEYNSCGWLTKVTDGKGQNIYFNYNTRGQLTRTSHGEWCSLFDTCDFGTIHIWNDYDQYGRVWRTRAENRNVLDLFVDPIEYTYDNTTGNLLKKRTTNNNGAVVRDVDYSYDINGNLEQLEDWAGGAGGNGHHFTYDNNGRLLSYTDYDAAQLTYSYDALGRPVAMNAYETDNNYGYAYTTGGQLSTLSAPGNKQWGFVYDNGGRLSYYTWPNGQRTEYTYDDDGRLTGLIHKNGAAEAVRAGWQYVLDDDDNIVRMVDARPGTQANRDYEYDHRNRLIRSNWWHEDGSPQLRMAYTYDNADNMLSQTRHTYTSRVYDSFADGNYTANPTWTVNSGTWSAASTSLLPTSETGTRIISTANSYGNADLWYSFKRVGTGSALLSNHQVQVRYVDENNWLAVQFVWNTLILLECVNGTQNALATIPIGSFPAVENTWYDIYMQLEGSSVVVFACERGSAMKRMLEGTTSLGATTNALRVCNFGKNAFAFDDFRVCSRSAPLGNDASFAYNAANQLVSKTSAGLTTTFNYDPWGRLAERSLVLGAYTFTANYTYRFGDKLQRIDSTFPDETPVILYNYDGLGKRRLKAVGDDTTYWRWDAGYSVLAEYHDQTPDWNIGGWDRFFVPFGHSALAEATMGADGLPSNAAYTYLGLDHLGSGNHGFDESKNLISHHIHLPFGQRLSTSGKAPYHEFIGKPWDEDTALYYFPYRYYSPSMNRWTSADPARLIDGPNVYGYVRGNPINKLDNFGLFSLDDVAIGNFKCDFIGVMRCLFLRGWLSNAGPYVVLSCKLCALVLNIYNPACLACIAGVTAGFGLFGVCVAENCERNNCDNWTQYRFR